ncbi:MAG: GAF domain-containing protein [Geminocystis sp.]|nr:GAF domain-containing protein [Geminocystis sp.]HIK36751.1 GAF domain-containing sensor histidine kinase [Geminocystis sp. M7585_C2015_104]MCS7146832.1 GAF domain-containing protein [Geminocystis sp.]MCX8077019.1 GAF domain-containing protein [Geminocystis sp.]MDW8115657.1 histidine kinase dimerization/phospho-acceptor domain-containing protein [Geminocystis sp.]
MSRPLFCPWAPNLITQLEEKRLQTIVSLDLLSDRIIPIFDEVTQTVANTIKTPVCCLGVLTKDEYLLKSAYGLSHLGLMNDLAVSRRLAKEDAFASYVVDSNSYLIIPNTCVDNFFSQTLLCQQYGVVSYLGVPLTTSEGYCIGCLEVFDTQPRNFTDTELNFLLITARWGLAEYERNLLKHRENVTPSPEAASGDKKITTGIETNLGELIFRLLTQLTQRLSIPLTSIVGMSSALMGGIYGQLNERQLNYLRIIHDSGQEMSMLVEEICELAGLRGKLRLELVPVDIESLGKQVVQSLSSSAKIREHTLKLSVEPGQKVWSLDREKVKKTLYYLITTLIHGCRGSSEIQVHISRQKDILKVNCRANHPWLGEGIPPERVDVYQSILKTGGMLPEEESPSQTPQTQNFDLICLSFATYLARLQGGNIVLSGALELGYRFILSLPIPS